LALAAEDLDHLFSPEERPAGAMALK